MSNQAEKPTNSKLVFRPEQFANLEIMKDEVVPRNAAEIAQEIYDQYLASCPVVNKYRNGANDDARGDWSTEQDEHFTFTHTARLVNVEKLETYCKHEPIELKITANMDGKTFLKTICKHCRQEIEAELEVKWKVK